MAFLVPKLVGLRAEINEVAPNRDHESDGWIGNLNHQKYVSGHNPDETGLAEYDDPDNLDEVRAIDVDADLRRPGLTMEMVANYLRLECRAGRITWIAYVIYNRRIASATNNWAWREYNGTSPHTGHMHVSANLRGDAAGYAKVGLASLLDGGETTMYGSVAKGATGDPAEFVQRALKALDPNALPQFGIDREYGDETAEWVLRLFGSGAGSGNYWGPVHNVMWAQKMAAKHATSTPGPQGPKGDPGPQGPKGDAAVLPPGARLLVEGP